MKIDRKMYRLLSEIESKLENSPYKQALEKYRKKDIKEFLNYLQFAKFLSSIYKDDVRGVLNLEKELDELSNKEEKLWKKIRQKI